VTSKRKAKPVSDTTEKKLANLKKFKSGAEWTGNAKGRPKGSRNKLGEDFISALAADFEEHGVATIAKVREEKPAEYVKVVASLMPKELNVRTNAVEELSDDELAAAIAVLQSVLATQDPDGGSAEKTRH
jgi:hypothetical protein